MKIEKIFDFVSETMTPSQLAQFMLKIDLARKETCQNFIRKRSASQNFEYLIFNGENSDNLSPINNINNNNNNINNNQINN